MSYFEFFGVRGVLAGFQQQNDLVDVSDILYFLLGRGRGKGRRSCTPQAFEEVAGGGGGVGFELKIEGQGKGYPGRRRVQGEKAPWGFLGEREG